MKLLEDKLGTFAKIAPKFSITDQEGNPLVAVQAGVSVVHGPFRLMVKSQVARITGVVTLSMTNVVVNGEQRYEFQGNGWRPQAKVGDLLMQDVEVPTDRWACGPELFGGTGWIGTVHEDLSVTYAKFGKPTLAIELPEGTMVVSREGSRVIPAGSILAMSDANKGDFYIWTPDVVEKYVRDYVEVKGYEIPVSNVQNALQQIVSELKSDKVRVDVAGLRALVRFSRVISGYFVTGESFHEKPAEDILVQLQLSGEEAIFVTKME